MEKIVEVAMNKTKDFQTCWWHDSLICAVIDEAARLGWVLRTSVTQVEWTEKGVEAVRNVQ